MLRTILHQAGRSVHSKQKKAIYQNINTIQILIRFSKLASTVVECFLFNLTVLIILLKKAGP
ncbi:hypothetical protein FDK13_09930 [Dyadobacter frigoris]|uniref:Uncharacterized protein n=1 Tax=Dyadobacter frigoris TaxID=2576211 RepID=A0A4U6D4P2_9BACT|nr:hypothetical protein FDK13_09930 [Dyadobacter frigoris]